MEKSEWQNSVVLQLTVYNKILRANTNISDWINKWRKGEKTNLMYRTIPDNLNRYSNLKQLEHDSPFLQCRPHKMASYQRIQYGKRETKHSFSVEKTITFYPNNVVKVNTSMICWHHVPFIWWDKNGTYSDLSPKNLYPWSNHYKNTGKVSIGRHSTKYLTNTL